MNETIKTQVIFATKEPVERVKDLWKLYDDAGEEYTTFNPDQYPLGNPMFVEYVEVKTKGKNRTFVNRRLVDKVKREYKPVATPKDIVNAINEGALIVEMHGWLKEIYAQWKKKNQ